jgi:hypothetical protein
MNNRVSLFHTTLDQRIDSASARVASTIAHHQACFQDYINSYEDVYADQVNSDISEAVQVALDEQITPILETHLQDIDHKTQAALAHLEEAFNTYRKRLENTNPTIAPPTSWPTHNYQLPINTTTPLQSSRWTTVNPGPHCTPSEHNPVPSNTVHRDRYGRITMRTINIKPPESSPMQVPKLHNHNYREWDTRHPNYQTTTRTEPSPSPTSTFPQSNIGFHLNANQNDHKTNGITTLNRHNFIKKGQIRFTGDMYTVYHKIHNIGKQYGVYTRKLQDVRHDLSLCPDSYIGHTFTNNQYEDMAAALYEKLSDPNVMPLTYTKYRNITDHYAEENDGYTALYKILEDSHPMMQKDPVFTTPLSTDCNNNLQIYASRFKSYITSENLSNCHYTPKEKVQIFLRGLDDDFHSAIQYVNTLMAAWAGRNDLNPLCEINAFRKQSKIFLAASQEHRQYTT